MELDIKKIDLPVEWIFKGNSYSFSVIFNVKME